MDHRKDHRTRDRQNEMKFRYSTENNAYCKKMDRNHKNCTGIRALVLPPLYKPYPLLPDIPVRKLDHP